jgi:hypothetical protein
VLPVDGLRHWKNCRKTDSGAKEEDKDPVIVDQVDESAVAILILVERSTIPPLLLTLTISTTSLASGFLDIPMPNQWSAQYWENFCATNI